MVAKPIMEKTTRDHVCPLLDAIVERKCQDVAERSATLTAPHIPRNIACTPRPDKANVIARHTYRFSDTWINLMQWLLKGFGQVFTYSLVFFCTCTPKKSYLFGGLLWEKLFSFNWLSNQTVAKFRLFKAMMLVCWTI